MANIHANGIDIEHECLGDPAGEPLLLIMGFGRQLVVWPDGFCALLVERGYRVIRYDNRDTGLSTMFRGERAAVPYTIDDMADDGWGLLGALGIEAAHIVGASMGGAIAQSLATRHPEAALSLTSIMSSPDPAITDPAPEVLERTAEPPVSDREGAIERAVRFAHVIGTPGMVDEARVRDAAGREWDRNPAHDGLERHTLAMLTSPNRTAALGRLTVPALVIHGEADPLVSVRAGRATAAAIPGARLLTIPGMGHDLPEQMWLQVVDAIDEVARRAATGDTAASTARS